MTRVGYCGSAPTIRIFNGPMRIKTDRIFGERRFRLSQKVFESSRRLGKL